MPKKGYDDNGNRLAISDSVDSMSVTFSVINQADEVIDSETFDAADLPESISDAMLLYGIKQKVSDNESAVTDRLEKLANMRAYWNDRATEGHFNKEAGERGAPTVGVHIEAIAQVMDYQVSDVQKLWRKQDDAKRAKILANPKVVEAIAEIEAKRGKVAEEGSLDDLL